MCVCVCVCVCVAVTNDLLTSSGVGTQQGIQAPIKASLDWLPQEIMQMSPIELIAQSVYIFWTTCMSPIWEEVRNIEAFDPLFSFFVFCFCFTVKQ